MTSFGDDICIYLQGLGIGNFNGAGAINLFSSLLPDDPDLAAAVIERGGLPPIMWLTGPGTQIASESKIDQPVFQIRTRAGMTGYVAGNALTQSIYKALQGVTETQINPPNGSIFKLIRAQQSPIYLGRDERERHMWSQNYFAMVENAQR